MGVKREAVARYGIGKIANRLRDGKLRANDAFQGHFTQTSHLKRIREDMMPLPLRGEPISVPFTGRRLLERALVVVRFTPVLRIGEESGAGIASFQEALRSQYPLAELEHEAIMRVEMKPDGTLGAGQEAHPVWRLSDIDRIWRVSLTTRSIALEVPESGYTNWADFAERMFALVAAVGKHFAPSHRQYIGVRYVNTARVDDGQDPRLECAGELVSITGNPDLEIADLLWRFTADEGHLLLRSGVMPPGGSYDPQVFAPREYPSWYLDIDISNDDTSEFAADQINSSIYAQVRRLHAIYLWAMKREAAEAQ